MKIKFRARTVRKTDTSFLTQLPIEWCRAVGLGNNAKIIFSIEDDGSLKVEPAKDLEVSHD